MGGIELDNGQLRVRVDPSRGGRVVSLFDHGTDREWAWTRSFEGPKPRLGDDYDSNWTGGFEELFPNDAPTTVAGRRLPDHGELWFAEWSVMSSGQQFAELRLRAPVTGVEITKAFTLDGSNLTVEYRLTHDGVEALPFLFKLHPAVAVHAGCRIELPGGHLEPVDPAFSAILPTGGPWPWPGPPGASLEQCHSPESRLQEFVYVHDLPEGWCAVADDTLARRLRLSYSLTDFPYCWLFLTYGGWRDHEVVVLEPCTNYPKDLHRAIERGSTAWLAPGEQTTLQATFTVEDTEHE